MQKCRQFACRTVTIGRYLSYEGDNWQTQSGFEKQWNHYPKFEGSSVYHPPHESRVFSPDVLRLLRLDPRCFHAINRFLAARRSALGQRAKPERLGAQAPDRTDTPVRRPIGHGGLEGDRQMVERAESRV